MLRDASGPQQKTPLRLRRESELLSIYWLWYVVEGQYGTWSFWLDYVRTQPVLGSRSIRSTWVVLHTKLHRVLEGGDAFQ